jgi:hypothetical protein
LEAGRWGSELLHQLAKRAVGPPLEKLARLPLEKLARLPRPRLPGTSKRLA